MKIKKFRVARSGPTIDGREITPEQIDQMAASYDPEKYGARIWIEHYRSLLPDGPFKAMGDVVSVSAEADGDARVLLAEIDATPDLIKLAADRQKVFWSIEIATDFAKSGGPYMVGLSVTDSPASLGTDMLTFAVQSDKAPEEIKSHLFSEALEAALPEAEPEKGASVFTRVKELLAGKDKAADARFSQVEASTLAIAEEVSALSEALAGMRETLSDFADHLASAEAFGQLRTDFDALLEQLSATDDQPPRKKASGANSNQTDC